MKTVKLKKSLKELGWYFLRQGKKHELWTNGEEQEAIGRHRDIPEETAKKILRTAKQFPGKK